MYDIFLLVKSGDNYIDLVNEYPNIKLIYTKDCALTEHTFNDILNKTMTKYFYVINTSKFKYVSFDFTFEPEQNKDYVYRWNSMNHLRLFCKKAVMKDVKKYVDDSSICPYKDIMENIFVENTIKSSLIDIFVLASDTRDAEHLKEKYPQTHIIEKDNNKVGFKTLWDILKVVTTDYFYVITDPQIETIDFDFSFYPEKWDNEYLHVWNNDLTIRLYSVEQVKKNPLKYAEQSIEKGKVKIKNHDQIVYRQKPYDIIFISFYESYADDNFDKLKTRFPRAKRVNGISGIFAAHKKAAAIARTPMFYVVDADAVITDNFDFNYQPTDLEKQCVNVWRSINPVNDLVYGYGGVKLFPTYHLRETSNWKIDFTTSIGDGMFAKDEISNTSTFNDTPFDAWKSGFREAVKLSSKIIHNQLDEETEKRLEVWCSTGSDRLNGKYVINGAIHGKDYGSRYADNIEALSVINNFNYLQARFNAIYDNNTNI